MQRGPPSKEGTLQERHAVATLHPGVGFSKGFPVIVPRGISGLWVKRVSISGSEIPNMLVLLAPKLTLGNLGACHESCGCPFMMAFAHSLRTPGSKHTPQRSTRLGLRQRLWSKAVCLEPGRGVPRLIHHCLVELLYTKLGCMPQDPGRCRLGIG